MNLQKLTRPWGRRRSTVKEKYFAEEPSEFGGRSWVEDWRRKAKRLDAVIMGCERIMKREEPNKMHGWHTAYDIAERIRRIAKGESGD